MATTTKSPGTAFLIEFVGGLGGLLGLGYFYMGRSGEGTIRLIVWLLYDLTAACTILFLLSATVSFLCIPLQLVIQVVVPLLSAVVLRNQISAVST